MKETTRAAWKKLLAPFRRNLGMKVIAVVFACIVWVYIMAAEDPVREKTLNELEVQFEGVASLQERDLTTILNLDDIIQQVEVTVRAAQKDLSYVNEDNVWGVVDFSRVNGAGDVTIKLDAHTAYGTVASVTPSEIVVTIDDRISRNIPVTLTQQGTQSDEYHYGTPTITPSNITITGPKSQVEKVVRGVCAINYTNVTGDVNRSFDVVLYDAANQIVDSSSFETLPACVVAFDVKPISQLTVDVMSCLTGIEDIARGYEITGVYTEPEKIRVAADLQSLESVQALYFEPIDVAGATSDISTVATLLPVDGVTYIDGNTIKVNISVGELRDNVTFSNVRVEARNAPEDMEVQLHEDLVDVYAAGGTLNLEKVALTDLHPYVDLAGLSPGVHDLPVQFDELDAAGVTLNAAPVTIRVTLT